MKSNQRSRIVNEKVLARKPELGAVESKFALEKALSNQELTHK